MKKVLLSFLAVALLSAVAIAQPAQCRVNATIYKPSGAADPSFTLTVFRIVLAGQVYSNQRQVFRANASGVLLGADAVAGVSLPQGSVVWMYANAPGFDYNPNSGTAFQIPNTSTAQLTALASATTVFRALGDLVYGGTDGIPARLPAGANGRCLVMVSGIPAWTVCAGGGGSSVWGNITGTLADQTDLQAALDAKANTSALAAVALSGAYADLTGKPSLGTAAALNVAASGDAASGEVVKGDDTRLTDARTPTAHTHSAADTVSGIFDAARIPDLSGVYSVLAHTHTFASLTSKPTTLSGYGITDAQPVDQDLTDIAALTGNGLLRKSAGVWGMDSATYLTGNQTVTLSGDLSGAGATSISATIVNNAISDAKIRQSSGLSILGRSANSTGNITDITAANDGEILRRSGTSIGFGTIATAGIGANQVTNAKLAQVATATFKGRTTAGTGDAEDLTATQATALLNVFVGDSGSGGTKGLVPAPVTGDATKFLRGDGIFAAVSAAPGGSDTWLQRNNAGTFGGISGATSDGTNVAFGSGNLRATSPRFITDISDSNGNEVFKITATSSAVNEITIANEATGLDPYLNSSTNIIGLRNSTTAQAMHIYNTFTSSTSYERAQLEWSSNIFRINIDKGSGGGSYRNFAIRLSNFTALSLDASTLTLGVSADISGAVRFGISNDVGFQRPSANIARLYNGGSGAATFATPALTPAQIASDQNNYAPGIGWFQRWSSDASRTITGLVAGAADGQICEIWNVGSQNIVLANESASSIAANRWTTSTGADLTLAANKCAKARYDTTSARWRVYLCN